MTINLIAQVCMYNEVEKGNLDRCLDNLVKYCDRVVIYDDASTDESVAIAERYGCHVIRGQANNQMQELAHKQELLDVALSMGATHLFWLDCDEVLDRAGTMGGLRNLCKHWSDDLDAYSFLEVNLWRSQTWQRLDSLFTKARFVRLWKVTPEISFDVSDGVHKRLFPQTIRNIQLAPYSVIHYGFWDYKRMMVKIGVAGMDREALQNCAEFGIDGQGANWLLDERECSCRRVPDDVFPPGCLPPVTWPEPKPVPISELLPYSQIEDQHELPLIDKRGQGEWARLHDGAYHGDYDSIHRRNLNMLKLSWAKVPTDERASLFRFDPRGKIIFDVGCGGGWYMLDCLAAGVREVVGLDVNAGLLQLARDSFAEMGINPETYRFVDMGAGCLPTDLPTPDIIYSVAVFMHLPFWQAMRYLRLFHSLLPAHGEAHVQFYQVPPGNTTMFWNGIIGANGDDVTTTRLDNEIERIGFEVVDKHMPVGKGIVPVWQMYRLKKVVKQDGP